MRLRYFLALAIALLPPGAPARAAPADFPEIRRLDNEDLLFLQLEEAIELYYASEGSGKEAPELSMYSYTLKYDTDIFSISARFNLPYESIATLNRIASAETVKSGTRLLLPSIPGVYLPSVPISDLEYLMSSWRSESEEDRYPIKVLGKGGKTDFTVFPGSRFFGEERAFFLNALFKFPLPKGTLSSGFGPRVNPLKGTQGMHSGIDLAARSGTEVFAAREGQVEKVGKDEAYGTYLLISHEGEWETLYGHLSETSVVLNQKVKSGMIIGRVGSTGMSTGPHLHFEIRNRGVPRDPENLLPRGKR